MAHGHEEPLVAEDDALIKRAAECIDAQRAVAANQTFFPASGGLEADEPALGDGQGM
jgi:hypothetical protein